MKYLLHFTSLIIFLLVTGNAVAGQTNQRTGVAPEGVFDHSTVEEAWKSAIAKKRPLLVMFTSENCTFCRKMIATYSHRGVQQMLRGRTESVMAHSDDYAGLIKKLGIRGYPSSLLISPEGEVLDFMEGYVDAKSFADRVGPLLDRPAERIGMVEEPKFAN